MDQTNVRWQALLAISSALLMSFGFHSDQALAQPPEDAAQSTDGPKFSFFYRPTYRFTTVYYEDTDATTLSVIFDDEKDNALTVPRWEPLRFGLLTEMPVAKNLNFLGRFIGGATSLRLHADQDFQNGFDGFLDLGGIFYQQQIGGMDRLRVHAAARVYHWFFAGSEIPDRGSLGLAVGIEPAWNRFSFLLEATTQALPLFNSERIGNPQDSSSFRMRAEYAILSSQWNATVGFEVFHTKAAYTATELIPGHTMFAWDDIQASFLFGLSTEL